MIVETISLILHSAFKQVILKSYLKILAAVFYVLNKRNNVFRPGINPLGIYNTTQGCVYCRLILSPVRRATFWSDSSVIFTSRRSLSVIIWSRLDIVAVLIAETIANDEI